MKKNSSSRSDCESEKKNQDTLENSLAPPPTPLLARISNEARARAKTAREENELARALTVQLALAPCALKTNGPHLSRVWNPFHAAFMSFSFSRRARARFVGARGQKQTRGIRAFSAPARARALFLNKKKLLQHEEGRNILYSRARRGASSRECECARARGWPPRGLKDPESATPRAWMMRCWRGDAVVPRGTEARESSVSFNN